MAERVGFEPTRPGIPTYTLSKRAPSATRTPLRARGIAGGERGIRTPETLAGLPAFEAGAFGHSAISPTEGYQGAATPRFARKNRCSRSRHSSARTPEVTDARWLNHRVAPSPVK